MPTSFCDLFNIKIPIIQAPMGGATTPELVAAVSDAGGLGLAPLWRADPAGIKDFVRRVKALTDAPFGVNLNMEYSTMDQLDTCLDEGVPVISVFWGDGSDFIAHARAGGAKVISSVGTAQEAAEAVDQGAHAICAQGWEAGGHVWGTVSTMALVPAVVDAVGETPVIAAGGIADGRGLAAALALGASGAWIGTRFLSAKEARIHPDYVSRLLEARETDTGYYEDLFDIGWSDAPHRVLLNSTTQAWEAAGRPAPGHRPDEDEIVASAPGRGDLSRYACTTPNPEMTGNIEPLSMWCGQGVSQVRKVQPAAEIMQEIVEDARTIISF